MEVRKFVSRGGIRVYGMPVETLPGHVNNIYPVSATTLQVARNRHRPLCCYARCEQLEHTSKMR